MTACSTATTWSTADNRPIVCAGCGLDKLQEPTVVRRSTGVVQCNDCAKKGFTSIEANLAAAKTLDQSDAITFKSGAKSSAGAPRYDLIDRNFLRRLATRLGEGAAKYGDNNWQTGLHDAEYRRDRYNHLVDHLTAFNNGDRSEDNLSAVACGLMFISWWEDRGKYPGAPIGGGEKHPDV